MRSSILILAALVLAACSTPPGGPGGPDGPPPGREASPIGGMCGGMMGTSCADPDAYCAYPAEAMCGAADQTGTCQIPPEVCTQQYQPVWSAAPHIASAG